MSEICTEYPAPATVGEKLALDLTTAGSRGINLYISRKIVNVLLTVLQAFKCHAYSLPLVLVCDVFNFNEALNTRTC